ncbi:LOW QUALITY PROTEIN: hypothetical protein U0070_003361 [Myodes glareolus]|uniref:Protein FAM33A n=1 Tax=Myodes glareolus TaxID=447135 RepID=A0AAW0JUI4_MYOGA
MGGGRRNGPANERETLSDSCPIETLRASTTRRLSASAECQLFNMEAEVDKLELMKNPGEILKELSAIKSRYQALCARFKPLSVEQKENKSRICATLRKTMTIVQELQKQTDLETADISAEAAESKQISLFLLLGGVASN